MEDHVVTDDPEPELRPELSTVGRADSIIDAVIDVAIDLLVGVLIFHLRIPPCILCDLGHRWVNKFIRILS